jgi:serine/threonine protein kinase
MLGDLGLAKDLTFDSGITVGVGTAGYMAPEQTLAGAKIDMRTDIYAASALLAQLASGEAPDPVRRVSNGRLETGRPLPPSIPSPLGGALLRGLDTDPDNRPQTIEQWLADVEAGLAASPAPPLPMVGLIAGPSAARGGGRRRWAIVAATAVVAVGGIGYALSSGGREGPASSSTVATTVASSTTFTSSSRVIAPNGFAVTLAGPTAIKLGVQAIWTVDAPGAVNGTWSLDGPVQPDPDTWLPGNYFAGTWNVQGTFQLKLTAVDADGNVASDTVSFTVS